MREALDRLGRRFLFSLEPERAHTLSIAALKTGLPLCSPVAASKRLKTAVAGLDFANPLGVAAGYDKNAEVPDALIALGFGFVECGTVTPLPQPGNERPRVFRLEADKAVINRLGFNNEGFDAAIARLKTRNGKPGIVGINIGANRDSIDRIADYEAGVRAFCGLASYLAVNVSSPNTAGLRALQDRASLAELLSRVMTAREEAAAETGRRPPVFLKIAPDLSDSELAGIASEVLDKGADGLIVANTTLSRAGLQSPEANEAGGLSGAPLFVRSTILLARMRQLIGPRVPIIGVGGVSSAERALEKIRAGADLVQLYTGIIYEGPSLAGRILRDMDAFARRQGISSISTLRDSRMTEWAERKMPE